MWKKGLLTLCFFLCYGLCKSACAALPEKVSSALKAIGLPEEQISVYVQALADNPAHLNPPLLSHVSSVPLNPASTMKLLTSYAGLSMLGTNYRWKTEVYTDGARHQDVLEGNLYLKGYGDPNFMTVDFWRLLNSLRQLGIREIKGDLMIDSSYFASQSSPTESFDGESTRAYNATPSAFNVNLKASSFRFDSNSSQVNITLEPNVPEIQVNNLLKVGKADCEAWRSELHYDVKATDAFSMVNFSGIFAPNCTERYLDLLVLDEQQYTLTLFRKLWLELGGEFRGHIHKQVVPLNANKLMQQDSKSLASILPEINKWSNNLMARQLLLTIAAERIGTPGTELNGGIAVSQWLKTLGLDFNELVIDNGSGLSRIERISAKHMGEMLVSAYYSSIMPELMSSLPVLAVDGTLKKRMQGTNLQGRAHLKTGTIDGVYTLAGYLLGQHGQRFVVVFMVNNTKNDLTRSVQEALLEWVFKQ